MDKNYNIYKNGSDDAQFSFRAWTNKSTDNDQVDLGMLSESYMVATHELSLYANQPGVADYGSGGVAHLELVDESESGAGMGRMNLTDV